MEQFLQQLASGLANGAIYACVALALVMIYVSTDHINFAQGEMAMFSTYISWQLMSWGMSYWAAFVLAVVISFILGVIIERAILRPLHNAPLLSVVVVFIGLLAICNSVAGAIWSYLIKEFPSPFPKSSFGIAGVIGPHQLGVVMVNILEIGGGCAGITNALTVKYTVAHPNLGPVSLSITGPGVPPPPQFTFADGPGATPQNRFGNATPTFAVAPLQKCAYIVKLTAEMLLTTGDSNPLPVQDEIAFCK